MKIAFVGDSFCANIDSTSEYSDWPAFVATQLDAKIIQGGYGGKHFYN